MMLDSRKLLFSVSSFLAAALTLVISFEASLPRPWWALLTVYVTAQPLSGAFRPKVFHRLGGIAGGAVVTVALVPLLQSTPVLLVLCMAIWIGFCIYLSVLDRTPRAYLFQMAAFSSAVISFPYLDAPGEIWTTTISRVEEMAVAIVCVTLAHMLLQPWSVGPLIRERATSIVADARRWILDVLRGQTTDLAYEHRRALAADVTELGMIAIHLPFDHPFAPATRGTVLRLQEALSSLLPISSGAASRLDELRGREDLALDVAAVRQAVIRHVGAPPSRAETLALIETCQRISAAQSGRGDWTSLLGASLCDRMAAVLTTLVACDDLIGQVDADPGTGDADSPAKSGAFPLARDHGVAALAGLAAGAAILLYCAVWILLAWPSGAATAAFAALITCSFAAQDDPAPVIRRYLLATLATFPLAALYLFVVLPRVDGYGMLIVTLAPALLALGYLQADVRRSAIALPMFSCLIVGLGFLDRFQADFAGFLNTGIAQTGGIITTIAVTKLFRSVSARWSARRLIERNWRDLELVADVERPIAAEAWTARVIDRLGQIASRLAIAEPDDALHAADGLSDLRIGRNLLQLRASAAGLGAGARQELLEILDMNVRLFRRRSRFGAEVAPPPRLCLMIDRAIAAMSARAARDGLAPLLALVGMRCNLFPRHAPYPGAERS